MKYFGEARFLSKFVQICINLISNLVLVDNRFPQMFHFISFCFVLWWLAIISSQTPLEHKLFLF